MVTRREFLDALAISAAGLAVGTTAKSYSQIVGSNDRLNFAVIGLNGRAYAHLSSLKANKSAARISHVCDVDGNILKKFAANVQQEMGEAPITEKDFRLAIRCGLEGFPGHRGVAEGVSACHSKRLPFAVIIDDLPFRRLFWVSNQLAPLAQVAFLRSGEGDQGQTEDVPS